MDDKPIRQQLSAGEQLLWSGSPRQGIRASCAEQAAALGTLIVMLGVWLFMLGSLFFLNLRDVEGQFDVGVLISGLIMFMAGGAILAVAVRYDVMDRTHRFYGLTDKRIILITGIRRPAIRSYPLQQLQRIDMRMRDDDNGTIAFADVSYTRWGIPVSPTFEKIDNVQLVYDLIHQARKQAYGQCTAG